MQKLSDLQKRIFDYICTSRLNERHTPSLREIAEHFALSKSGAGFHVRCLRNKGFLYRKRYSRGFVVLKREISSGAANETPVYATTLPGEVTKRGIFPENVCCCREKEQLFEVQDEFMHTTGIRKGDLLAVSSEPPVTGDLVVVEMSAIFFLRIYSAVSVKTNRYRRNIAVYNPLKDPGIVLAGKIVLIERRF